MRIFFLLLIISIVFSGASAQNVDYLDSLHIQLNNARTDSLKARTCFLLGYEWLEYSTDSTYAYGLKLREFAQKLESEYQLMYANRLIAMAYDYSYEADSAIYYYQQTLTLAEKLQDTSQIALAYFNIGTVNLLQGEYIHVLPYYEKALELCKSQKGLEQELGMIYNNLGIFYRRVRQFDDALAVYLKAKQLQLKLGNERGLEDLYLNIANNYVDIGNFDSARYYFAEVLAVDKLKEKGTAYQYANNGLGVIAFEEGKFDSAGNYFEKTVAAIEVSDKNLKITANGYLGEIALHNGDFDLAEKYLKQALEYHDEEKFADQAKELYLQLSKFYKTTGQLKQALDYQERYNNLNNRLLNEEIINRTTEWEKRYQSQQKEEAIIRLQLANEQASLLNARQRNERNILLFVVLLFVLLTMAIYLQFKANQKNSRILADKNLLISKALEEKDLLMREIHHRVKNNLQIISSLLNMQSYFIDDGKASAAVQDSKNRVHAMSLIHQNLYGNEQVTEVAINEYLGQLLANLESGLLNDAQHITVTADIEPIAVDVDQAIPMGLIVNELVTNAFKHAFTDQKEGELVVSFKPLEDNYLLIIKDNGKGNDGKPHERKSSLGMRLLHDLGKKLKAEIVIETQTGTSIQLKFPMKKQMK